MPGPWICTPLLAGPLASNCYCITIPGLSASTCYEYRSVFVVSGTCYCGNILEGVTQPPAMSIPLVTTGIAPHPALTDGYMTCCHTVDNNGNLTIQEYGILYTANPSYNSDLTLVCANLPTNVLKTSTCGSISIATPYSAMTTGLPSNSVTYYRAFAVNAIGVGYGCIYSKITASAKEITLCRSLCSGANGSASTTRAYNVYSTPLMTAGESYCLCMEFPLGMASALFGTGSYTSVGIDCNATLICFACITNQACCIPSILCTMNYGDTLTVAQWASTTTLGCGGLNACVCIKSVTPIIGSFQVSTTCCKDCAYTG